MWTAGRNFPECPGKFEWCSNKLNDFLKSTLSWKKEKLDVTNACVYVDFEQTPGHFEDPTLETDDCQQEKFFVCEVKLPKKSMFY